MNSSIERFLARAAAILMMLGLLTGILVGQAMTGGLKLDAHAALAAHLNALMGVFWILGFAWTLPMLRYSETGKRRLAWLVVIPNYANWLVTTVKGFLGVSGVAYSGYGANDAVFFALILSVVLPSFAAGGGWLYGLYGDATEGA